MNKEPKPISLGTQLIAPDGFEQMRKDVIYVFLVSSAQIGSARLVHFHEQPQKLMGKGSKAKLQRPPPSVELIGVKRDRFEWAVNHGLIDHAEIQTDLPGRQAALGTVTVESLEEERYKKKVKPHKDRIDRLINHMEPIVSDIRAFLLADDPIAFVNNVARTCLPEQNEARFRASVFLYIAYKQNRNVLAYQVQNVGRWNRNNHPGAKCGVVPNGLGKLHGHTSNDEQLKNDAIQGWDLYSMPGRNIGKVYRIVCLRTWKCPVVKDGRGRKRFVRLDGEPFMTYHQFYYRVVEHYGLAAMQKTMYGRARYREDKAASKGHFSEAAADICERTEEDGYWVKEVALAADTVTHLPPLIVVRIIDVATSFRLGVGFSLGGESGDAYRMARFCMAVGGDFFCFLFGMQVAFERFPTLGLSADTIVDRGPGQGKSAQARGQAARPVFNEMPPTGSGQGKASVESTNPRSIRMRDRPSFVLTQIPLIDLMRREIRNTIAENDSHDIHPRLGPRRISQADRITPLDLFEKLSAVGRTAAMPISRDQALREFLTSIPFELRADGVYIDSQRYDSTQLRASGILDRVPSPDAPLLKGFQMDMALRYAWVEVRGALIMVAAMLHLREDHEQLFLCAMERRLLNEKLAEMIADFDTHQHAVKGEADEQFHEETGHYMSDSKRLPGKPKRNTKEAREEGKAVKKALTPHRRAA